MVLIGYERNLDGGIDFVIGNKAWLSVEDCTVIKAYILMSYKIQTHVAVFHVMSANGLSSLSSLFSDNFV